MKVWLREFLPDEKLLERKANSDEHLTEGKVSPDVDPIVGQALDLRDAPIDAQRVLAGVRDPESETVVCAPPSAVHDHVGHIHEDMQLDRREALVAAARSRGLRAPQDPEIERLDRRIEAISPEEPDLRAARERAAEAGESVDTLRERVARLSGRLTEARETGRETADLAADLQAAIRELTEAETEAAAARQALDTAAERAARERRAERLSLVDRRDNLRRRARSWLVDRLEPRFETALASLPVESTLDGPCEYSAPAHHAALAVARVARVRAPIVLFAAPFDRPVAARAALGAPVVLV